ncbi:uncharacterized protein LOC113238368 [Hyposmocoma kahamanoa]|uniref:uncharacterized protein LOC113238368 n=1 Tax=Hyposmocoma kahamanoa TaxID=1477025 RepID=UPI000E6D756D|nr:uncharacterized protein LOC113238368 [Hyposmocoma kahamanoa]
MPPFRKGLSKRKLDNKDSKLSSIKKSSNEDDLEGAEDSWDEKLFAGELRDGSDSDNDSESETRGDTSTDSEIEGVLFQDDADSTLGVDVEGICDQSSELTDSGEEYHSEESSSTDEDSGEESGLGHTHSGSSLDEGLGQAHSQLQDKTNQSKKAVKTNKGQDSSNSIEILANKTEQTDVVIQPVGQKGSNANVLQPLRPLKPHAQ